MKTALLRSGPGSAAGCRGEAQPAPHQPAAQCSAAPGPHRPAAPQLQQGRACSRGRSPLALGAAVVEFPAPPQSKSGDAYHTVADAMTRQQVISVRPGTSIDEALDLLVDKNITGLPVVDPEGRVVGVVSDYDLLSLDSISGKMEAGFMFPEASQDWQAFFAVQKLVLKNAGKTVEDVMTPEPITVREDTNLEAAAKILLERKVRRLPVVNERGGLVGVFTRRDMIKAALRLRQAAEDKVPVARLG